MEPMMHGHRMPAISVGIIVRIGGVYDARYHWRNEAGELHASVGFDAGGTSNAHIQGSPAALRELAAALVEAADQAEEAELPEPVVAVGS
jgi:major membrane immunogen (membrane-anchored lipoprotein)